MLRNLIVIGCVAFAATLSAGCDSSRSNTQPQYQSYPQPQYQSQPQPQPQSAQPLRQQGNSAQAIPQQGLPQGSLSSQPSQPSQPGLGATGRASGGSF